MQRKRERIVKPHTAVTQLKQLTNSYPPTLLLFPSGLFWSQSQTLYHFNHKDFSILFLLTKRYCLRYWQCPAQVLVLMGQISDIHIPPVNYVLEKGITYIHSFHCILYKLNHCTHTHATSVPSLRGNWVLKDKSYLVYDNTVILYNYYYTQSNSSCSCVFLWNKCSKTSLMQKIFSQLSLPLVGLRFWSINPLSSAFVEFKPTWIK